MANDRRRVFSLFLGALVVAALLVLDLAFGRASLWIYGPEVVSGRYFEDPAVGRLLIPGARVEVNWRDHPTGRLLLSINAAGFR